MQNYKMSQIRNVIIMSHGGAGKTSLAEAMLFNAGAINRLGKVDEGSTTSDYDPAEIKRRMSIYLSLLPCEWKESKINIIDAPGYSDFVGEVKSGVRIADGAIIVVCAVSSVEVGTEQVWQYAEEQALPRIIFINKMDRDNANFARVIGDITTKLGKKCVPVELPIGSQKDFKGIIDLIENKAYLNYKEGVIPAEMASEVKTFREKMIETIVENDDELLNKYLEGQEVTAQEIRHALRKATLVGKVIPVLVGSALQNEGVKQLLDSIRDNLPSPLETGEIKAVNTQTQQEEVLKIDENAPLAALVFKTTADPYVGKLTYLRVYSGIIMSNSQVWNSNKKQMERIGQLYLLRGKTQEPIAKISAGDIGVVAKLSVTSTGDTLAIKEHPLQLAPPQFPRPVYSVAVSPKTKADMDKLGEVLNRAIEEDMTLQLRREPDTGEIILSGMGDSHLDVVTDKIQQKFGVGIEKAVPQVPCKETITTTSKAEYKHKKQTGGHGQYGHVMLEFEPKPRGTGFEFGERVVGGRVPKNYIPAVEKGVMEAQKEGVLAGYPVTDVKVTLYDGSFHPVDSSEISFKIAGAGAFKKGIAEAHPVLVEPIMHITVKVPEECTGDIVSDLNGKRARLQGMASNNGIQTIEALAPLSEIQRYAIDLRSITQGRGTFIMEYSHYEEVPPQIAQKIIAQRTNTDKEKE